MILVIEGMKVCQKIIETGWESMDRNIDWAMNGGLPARIMLTDDGLT